MVGFFLQIGIGGLPDQNAVIFALVMAIVLPLKGVLFFGLMVLFKLRARSAFLTSLSLTNYSEFGLIVASIAIPEWIIPLALTVAFSFVLSAPLNRFAHTLYERLSKHLILLERKGFHPDEQPLFIDDEILIVGMGRTGMAAYTMLHDKGYAVLGIDSDPIKVEQQAQDDIHSLFADAEDTVFWTRLHAPHLKYVILAANDLEAKTLAAQKLRESGFKGLIVSHCLHPEHAESIRAAGVNFIHKTFSETGLKLAEHVLEHTEPKKTLG